MRVKPARILCATDFSPASNHALPYAVGFARKFQARLFVCHAVDISSLELSSAAEFVLPYTREELTQRAEREIQRHMAGAGVDWEPVLLQGEPATEVAGAAERLGVDLVVLATHGRSGLQRLIVGSVTERLLRVLRCPVLAVHAPERELVAPGTYELRLRRILVGCDFSSDSSRALEHAISLAQELQAEIHLVHVLEPSLHLHLSATTKALATELERAVDEAVRRKLAELVPEDAAAWCSPKAFVASGLPWEKITEHARANAADLIVLGQHGHGLLDRLLVGSTTDRVLRKAPCPILVVRPQRTTEA